VNVQLKIEQSIAINVENVLENLIIIALGLDHVLDKKITLNFCAYYWLILAKPHSHF
jgi:hypothetical protein